MKSNGLFPSFKASLILVSLLFLLACSQPQAYVKLQGAIFGTTFHITYKDPSTGVSKDIILSDIEERLKALDLIFSTYKTNSEISRFNQLPAVNAAVAKPELNKDNSLTVSDDFIYVLDVSRQVYQDSNHAFNPAIGQLVNLWGFGPKLTLDNFETAPKTVAIKQALQYIDFNTVKNIQRIVYKSSPISIDFSAVAKGYAVDQIAVLLNDFHIQHYMIEIGGELVTLGNNTSGKAWRIGVETPDALSTQVSGVLDLHDAALATSGDYRNFFEVNGKRYSHTIDPRTGYPVTHGLASVTVIGESSAIADAWATAFMVLGEKDGLALAKQHKISSLFIFRENNAFKMAVAANFEQYMHQ